MSGKHTLIRLALAVLVVGSVVANPLGLAALDTADPTKEAQAASVTINCSPEKVLSPDKKCGISFNDGEIEDIQDHLGVYSEATAVNAQTKGFLDLYENYAKSTEDTGWLVANNATAHAYNSGLTKSETKVFVKEEVNEYYTIKQLNYINAWNNYVAALDGMVNRSRTVSGSIFDSSGVWNAVGWTAIEDDQEYGPFTHDNLDNIESTKQNVTLLNGSKTEILEIAPTLHHSDTPSNNITVAWSPLTDGRVIDDNSNSGTGTFGSIGDIIAIPPDTSENAKFSYFYPPRWNEPYNQLIDTKDEILNESGLFIEQTWLGWEQGNIDPQDIIAQTNAMNRWQTDATSESATFNDVVAGLAASGLSTPDPSETGYLNMTFRPNNLQGNLSAQGMLLSSTPPPNETWQIGKTYNNSNLSGVQTVVALGESGASTYTVNSTAGILRIDAAYDRDGNLIEDPQLSAPEREVEVTHT